jgi:hypothetical protein
MIDAVFQSMSFRGAVGGAGVFSPTVSSVLLSLPFLSAALIGFAYLERRA